ncbi:unknown [Acetobacter sp. CAG:267]|nr:unknown [Acetobacter sp. CAG:267]
MWSIWIFSRFILNCTVKREQLAPFFDGKWKNGEKKPEK